MAVEAVAAPVFVIIPALVMGGIIGLVELFFVHADESGLGWLGHGLHALPVTMLFVFISMNIEYVFRLLNLHITASFWVQMIVRILIGIIAMLKITGAASIAPHTRIGERKVHVLIVGALVIIAPYLWDYVLVNMLPASLGGKI
ncbi:hypothetical protein COT48_04600 [Candidatus Woesearchaeota archaeon CG08_land_8_20_14_0_20_47_9]|nr:MAG: hypothetical protein AUJ69_02745 [Candidatus Woesearchaeota archaeon CG1_02_47_18]PIO03494.1 MAG: hypothetical protein COT48_04600 [Candidatus Woesearchaeota archaeon CG08_land_8_20_14_0_20_47_9]HII30158.1 hypothetical protein [Candidatus Woesearchaeota archaeon]